APTARRKQGEIVMPTIVRNGIILAAGKNLGAVSAEICRYHTGFAIIAGRRETGPVLLFPNACECRSGTPEERGSPKRCRQGFPQLQQPRQRVDRKRSQRIRSDRSRSTGPYQDG